MAVPRGFASIPSKRSRSITFSPARRCSRLAPPVAISRASSARTGTFRKRARLIASRTKLRRRRSRQPLRTAASAIASGEALSWTRSSARGIKTVAVSAGYIAPEPRVEFFGHMDVANIDLKGFTEGFYKTLCSGKLSSVLETHVWCEITTLLIPGENDSADEIEAESRWVMDRLGPDVPLHFTAFHPDWKMLDTPPTPPQTLKMARRIAIEAGLRYVYTGNIHDSVGQSTYCHGCGTTLIGRDWYDLTAWNITADGRCGDCGVPCAGVFDAGHVYWGARRQPVRVQAVANS